MPESKAELIFIGDIGLGLEPFTRFTTLDDITIENIFKLYPWEWLLADKYGKYVVETFDRMTWIEPIWKLILSSKGHPACSLGAQPGTSQSPGGLFRRAREDERIR